MGTDIAPRTHLAVVARTAQVTPQVRRITFAGDDLADYRTVAPDDFLYLLLPPPGRIELRVEVDYERLRFAYRSGGESWRWLPEVFDASILSDEATAPGAPNFTGAFVGMACQDMSGTAQPADFDWFEYREREYRRTVED